MKQVAYDLCSLAAYAVNGIIPDKEKIEAMNLENLYKMSQMHSLSALCAMAIMSAGVSISSEWNIEKEKAIRKTILFATERANILRFFEENGIWYLPMKGIILSGMYPKMGMREMADNDILYDKQRQADVVAFMKANGYNAKSVGRSHHDTFYKEPVYNFEMHTIMFADVIDERFTAYYENLESRLIANDGTAFARHLSDDDFYIHMTAHEYKHYSRGGTGLRSLLDKYVYLKKKREMLNFDYINTECEKLGISRFEQESRVLCEKVFTSSDMPELTEAEQEMLEYYMRSTTYGTLSQGIRHKIEKEYGIIDTSSKIYYLLRRVFPKTDFYKAYSPIAYKYRILLPFIWFFRITKAILGKRKQIIQEINTLQVIKEKENMTSHQENIE